MTPRGPRAERPFSEKAPGLGARAFLAGDAAANAVPESTTPHGRCTLHLDAGIVPGVTAASGDCSVTVGWPPPALQDGRPLASDRGAERELVTSRPSDRESDAPRLDNSPAPGTKADCWLP
jgi:hypothetical protein